MTTIAEYLVGGDVQITPVAVGEAGAPEISISVPEGWLTVDTAMFPGAYGVWTLPPEDGWADNVVLLLGRLSKPVNAAELLECSFSDARQLPQWQELGAEIGDYQGYPSASVTGTYAVEQLGLWVHTRYVLVAVGSYEYLVQATFTARADGPGIDPATIDSLRVAV